MSLNETSIVFNETFKTMMRTIKNHIIMAELKALYNTNALISMAEVQSKIRSLVPTQFIKKQQPDYYACMICLLINLDRCECWTDVSQQINTLEHQMLSDDNLLDAWNQTIQCACSHPISTKTSHIISNGQCDLVLGCVCIIKYEINTLGFKEIKKHRTKQIKKLLEPIKKFKQLAQNYNATLKTKIAIQIWIPYLSQLVLNAKEKKAVAQQKVDREIQQVSEKKRKLKQIEDECRPMCKECGIYFKAIGSTCLDDGIHTWN
jgi:hypothetical protein